MLVTLGSAGVQLCPDGWLDPRPGSGPAGGGYHGRGRRLVGTLAALLAAGYDLEQAAEGATAAAAESVTWSGARPA